MNPLLEVILNHGLLFDAVGVIGLGLLGFAAVRLARRNQSWGGTMMAVGAIALLLARLSWCCSRSFWTTRCWIHRAGRHQPDSRAAAAAAVPGSCRYCLGTLGTRALAPRRKPLSGGAREISHGRRAVVMLPLPRMFEVRQKPEAVERALLVRFYLIPARPPKRNPCSRNSANSSTPSALKSPSPCSPGAARCTKNSSAAPARRRKSPPCPRP